MDSRELPARPNLEQYKKQAKDLVKAIRDGKADALERVRQAHPQPVRPDRFSLAEAQLVIAREHGFASWPKFAEKIRILAEDPGLVWKSAEEALVRGDAVVLEISCAITKRCSGTKHLLSTGRAACVWITPAMRGPFSCASTSSRRGTKFESYLAERSDGTSLAAKFELAADAIAAGDEAALGRLLRESPELVHARSTRKHHAPLLHYVGGINGGEGYRQKCPKNAVALATLLLDAGAPVDVLAGPYGNCSALGSIATSITPRFEETGLKKPLTCTSKLVHYYFR